MPYRGTYFNKKTNNIDNVDNDQKKKKKLYGRDQVWVCTVRLLYKDVTFGQGAPSPYTACTVQSREWKKPINPIR